MICFASRGSGFEPLSSTTLAGWRLFYLQGGSEGQELGSPTHHHGGGKSGAHHSILSTLLSLCHHPRYATLRYGTPLAEI